MGRRGLLLGQAMTGGEMRGVLIEIPGGVGPASQSSAPADEIPTAIKILAVAGGDQGAEH